MRGIATVTPDLTARCEVNKVSIESDLRLDEDLRTICVNVRMNRCEIGVLDGVCRAFGARRAQMLRALALSSVPSPIPEINRSAFDLIASMSSDLHRLLELASYDGDSISASDCLQRIEAEFSTVRAALLGVSQLS